MKRLIKKSNNEIEKIKKEVLEDQLNYNNTNMIQLDELDEADVRHDMCPMCKFKGIINKDGFKVCPKCLNIYKIFNGKSYLIKE